MSHPITFVSVLLVGGGLIAAILATNFFDNHPAAVLLVPVAALLATFGLYGLLARLVLRDDRRDLDSRAGGAASVGMRLTSVPLILKIIFFFLLLPLLLPFVRRARSWAGVAARAMGFWLGLGALGGLVLLLVRLLFHH